MTTMTSAANMDFGTYFDTHQREKWRQHYIRQGPWTTFWLGHACMASGVHGIWHVTAPIAPLLYSCCCCLVPFMIQRCKTPSVRAMAAQVHKHPYHTQLMQAVRTMYVYPRSCACVLAVPDCVAPVASHCT